MAPKAKSTRKSRSERADIILPVSRLHRHLKKAQIAKRISAAAPVYCGGALEYLVAELLELAGNIAKENNKKRINPRHVLLAIRNDSEFSALLSDVTIPSSGVVPNIHPNLAKPKAEIVRTRQWKDYLPPIVPEFE